jgi:hypothetical protein
MDTYEVVVLVGVKNAVREIVSPTTYETLDQANAALAKIATAQRGEIDWPDVPWLAVKGADVSAAFVRASERRNGRPADLESLVQRMGEILGFKPAGAQHVGGDDELESAESPPPSD